MKRLIPYATSYGKLLNITAIEKELFKYMASNSGANLNYEFSTSNDVEIVIITGYNDEEKDLGVWDHPIVMKNHKDQDVVVIDLRKYVSVNKEQPMNIMDVAKDKNVVEFLVLRALLTADFACGEYGRLRNIFKSISSGYASIVANVTNSIVILSPLEMVYVEIAAAYHASILFIEEDDIKSSLGNIEARLSNMKFSLPINKKVIASLMEKMQYEDRTIVGLVKNIQSVLPPEKQPLINNDAMVNMVSNIWYGPSGTETVIMALEHMPTWVALLYTSIVNKTYKRTRLATVIAKASRQINVNEFEKGISLYLKEHTLSY
jgi:hypothetical protein